MLQYLLVVLCYLAGFAGTSPIRARLSAQPPNGTIQLHHNPTTSTWYLLVSLEPNDYAVTKGNKTILGQHNAKSIVTVYFTISEEDPTATEKDYTIHSTPVAFEHHIDDPLTELLVYNLAEPTFPEGQPAFFGIEINGDTLAGTITYGVGGPEVLHASGFTADLNESLNITGIFRELNRVGRARRDL